MTAKATASRARTARTHRVGAGVALAVLVAQTAIGCSGSDKAGDASSGYEGAAESRSAQPSPSPSGDHSASAEPSLSAADGQDIGACADGNCQIAVSDPVTLRFKGPAGPTTLSVTEVGPDKVEYTVKTGNGQSEGGASGPGSGCVTVLRRDGSGNSCGGLTDARPSPQPNAVVIQVVAGQDGTAILDVVSD